MDKPIWHINLFGPLRASSDFGAVTKFRTRNAGLLLAYLACSPHRAYRRDDLVEMLWAGVTAPGENLNHRLSVTLNSLRQTLEVSASTAMLLIADRATIRLNGNLILTDKAQFEECLKAAQSAPATEERNVHLKQAAALYTGDFLNDYRAEWIEAERRHLSEACLSCLRQLTKSLAQAGQYEEALEYARRALALDPFNETLHQNLMKLYVAVRRPRAALRQYQELTTALRRDLHTLPAQATTALAQEIAAKSAGASNQSGIIVAAAEFYGGSPFGMQARRAAPGTWPALTKRLFGRQDDIHWLSEMLATPEKRLITMTGTAGCGKTHLALAVMQKMHEEFAGAALFVPLASVMRADAIPDAIAEAANLSRERNGDPLEETIRLLGQGPFLLVLDNMEHLLDEGSAVIWALLNLVPSLTCLVTSRQVLNLSIEHEYVVRPLALPQQAGSSERLQEFPSVQLFLDRALGAQPEFKVDAENINEIVAVCERLDGLPLGIELAAAWTKMLTPAQILQLPSSQMTTRHSDIPARHISLNTALEWSYALLPAAIKRFFVSLSIFRRGWSLEAAIEICEEPLALEYLMQLRERSLLDADTSQISARYTLLETVREYTQGRLAKSEWRRMGKRHAAYFLHRAEESVPHLQRETAVEWLDQLQADQDNIRAALQFCAAEGEKEMGLRLATALCRFWIMRGYPSEGSSWLKTMLAGVSKVNLPLQGRAFAAAGNLAYTEGELEPARHNYDRALEIRRSISDERGIASSLGSLGMVACDQRDFGNARALLEQSLKIFARLNDETGMAKAQGNLVITLAGLRDYNAANEFHAACMDTFRAQGDYMNQALALYNMAMPMLNNKEPDHASPYLREALEISCRLRNADVIAHVLIGCILLAVIKGKMTMAAHLLGTFTRAREAITGGFRPQTMQEYQQNYETVKLALEPAAFEVAWRQGYAMPATQIFSYTTPLF